MLKNETIIETPRDVDGVLDLCHVLVKDQSDVVSSVSVGAAREVRRQGPYFVEREDLAEEQGWIARMVHLFKAASLDVQFEVGGSLVGAEVFVSHHTCKLLQTARRHFEAGGDRMRYTFPSLITSSIRLCRRYKNRQHLVTNSIVARGLGGSSILTLQEDDWQSKVTTILKFVRQCTSILATQVDAPVLALRLFLLAAQIASECGSGFTDLTYDFYVQAFSVYEDSISESRAQLAAITLIIGTLQTARVFELDVYDTLITKAALHGAKLLKKPHQATAVHAASHLWWQEMPADEGDADTKQAEGEKSNGTKDREVRAVRCDLSRPLKLPDLFCSSIPIRTASVCSSVCRRHCALQILLRKR